MLYTIQSTYNKYKQKTRTRGLKRWRLWSIIKKSVTKTEYGGSIELLKQLRCLIYSCLILTTRRFFRPSPTGRKNEADIRRANPANRNQTQMEPHLMKWAASGPRNHEKSCNDFCKVTDCRFFSIMPEKLMLGKDKCLKRVNYACPDHYALQPYGNWKSLKLRNSPPPTQFFLDLVVKLK